MMLRCPIVETVGLVDLVEMHQTDCFGRTRLGPHIPSYHYQYYDYYSEWAEECHSVGLELSWAGNRKV